MNNFRVVVSRMVGIVILAMGWGLPRSGGAVAADAPKPALGTEIVHPVDRAVMVYVPAGEFIMGLDRPAADAIARQLGYDNYETPWMWEAFPERRVYLRGFFIDKYEVTVERWLRFMRANPEFSLRKDEISQHFEDPRQHVFPVGSIHWNEAQQYANWAGKQLPSDLQWEKAARGEDGRFFPWGNDFDPAKGHFAPCSRTRVYTRVGRYPGGASPCGAMDMVGNQYEFTREWLEPYPNNPEAERMLSYTGQQNVGLRGGSWYHGRAGLYASKRFGFPQWETHYHVGFRTVWEPPAGYFESAAFQRDQAKVTQRIAELDALFDDFDQAFTPEIDSTEGAP